MADSKAASAMTSGEKTESEIGVGRLFVDDDDDANDDEMLQIYDHVRRLNAMVEITTVNMREIEAAVEDITTRVKIQADARVAVAEQRLAEAFAELAAWRSGALRID